MIRSTKILAVLLAIAGSVFAREHPLLFNVEQGLGERFDRAAEQPEIISRLPGKLDAVTALQKEGQSQSSSAQ